MLQNTTRANCKLDKPSVFGDVERIQQRNQQTGVVMRLATYPTVAWWSSVHDPRCDRFTTMMRRHTKTSRNTRETWENEYYVKTNSRTKTSLGKTRLSSLEKSPDGAHWLMRVLMQHHHRQRVMTTREDESMNLLNKFQKQH